MCTSMKDIVFEIIITITWEYILNIGMTIKMNRDELDYVKNVPRVIYFYKFDG